MASIFKKLVSNSSSKQPGEGGGLNKSEIERLQRRFQRISKGLEEATIVDIQQNIPELSTNPFLVPILTKFDTNKDGRISLQEFTGALEYFSTLKDPESKFQFAFDLYDEDHDGYVSPKELYRALHTMLGQAMSASKLEAIVDATIQEYDHDGDGVLSFQEFRLMLTESDVDGRLSLQ